MLVLMTKTGQAIWQCGQCKALQCIVRCIKVKGHSMYVLYMYAMHGEWYKGNEPKTNVYYWVAPNDV